MDRSFDTYDVSVIKKGTLILLSSGEYSDYSTIGLYKTLRDIPWSSVKDKYIELNPAVTDRFGFDEQPFIDFLKSEKYIESVNYVEWYLSSYSNISEMRVTKNKMEFS